MSTPDNPRNGSPDTYPQRCAEQACREIVAEMANEEGPDHLESTAGMDMARQAVELLDEQDACTDAPALLRWSLRMLRQCRDLAVRAKSRRAADAVRSAIRSMEGAVRNAERSAGEEDTSSA